MGSEMCIRDRFCVAVALGFGIARPACFTGREVRALKFKDMESWPIMVGAKEFRSPCSISSNLSESPFVTRWVNCHSCWSDFCKPAQAV